MKGYLICEDGPLSEWVFTFEDGDQWLIGRDGDSCTFVIEDPMVSRKHLSVFLEGDKFFIQNESSTNPALLNDTPLEEKSLIQENDLVQIGNNVFRFSLTPPEKSEEEKKPVSEKIEEEEPLTLGRFDSQDEMHGKWIIKVITGPSSGALFTLTPGQSYIIGSDPGSCDIILHDISISKNHARITLSEEMQASIVDLESRNGVYVNSQKIKNDRVLEEKDLITLGTTSILYVGQDNQRETIYSPGSLQDSFKDPALYGEPEEEKEEVKNWKDTFIPTKHLAVASIFSVFVCVGIISLLALFRSSPVDTPLIDETKDIKAAISHFEDVEFNYNKTSATLFLSGHVMTDVDYSELMYKLKNIPYVASIDDNVIIDEAVYENINAMILKNPAWKSVLMTASKPGQFVLTGYIKNEAEKTKLSEFLNKYFNYLDLLENHVVVEETLDTNIENLLIENGFGNVLFQQNNGRLILSGRAHEDHKQKLEKLVSEMEKIHGIRTTKNFVIFTTKSSIAIDITNKYQVMGSSKHGDQAQFVLINSRILGVGDTLDGMTISSIVGKEIFLHKDGVKYKIDFND